MNTIFQLVLAAIAIYAALIGWLYFTQRSMIYFPGEGMGTPMAAGLADTTPVTLRTEDGLDLTAWYRAPEVDGAAGGRVLVYFHGNAGSIAGRAGKVQPYLDAGYGVLLVEYRGYGGNPGTPSEQGLYADATAALRFLGEGGISPARWVLYGESLGTAIATEAAYRQALAGDPVGALVLEAPFTSLEEIAEDRYPYVPVKWLIRDRYLSIDKVGHVATFVLVVHGEEDAVVPSRLGHVLFAVAKAPKDAIWVAGAGHNNLYDFGVPQRVIAALERWFTP